HSLNVEFYRSFVDTRPAATCGTFAIPSQTTHPDHSGGAALCLTYHPHGTDPTNIHWIQAVLTNAPKDRYADTTFNGETLYLDNFGNPAGNPFYDIPS